MSRPITLRARAGTAVILAANPVSRCLSGGLPPDGTAGKVHAIAGPRGPMTSMPGPGGGLLYVLFEDGTHMGVSPHDLRRA